MRIEFFFDFGFKRFEDSTFRPCVGSNGLEVELLANIRSETNQETLLGLLEGFSRRFQEIDR